MDLDGQFPDGMFRFEKVMKSADRSIVGIEGNQT